MHPCSAQGTTKTTNAATSLPGFCCTNYAVLDVSCGCLGNPFQLVRRALYSLYNTSSRFQLFFYWLWYFWSSRAVLAGISVTAGVCTGRGVMATGTVGSY